MNFSGRHGTVPSALVTHDAAHCQDMTNGVTLVTYIQRKWLRTCPHDEVFK